MTTIQLTKLESALDQIRKSYPKLMPADAALLATALSLTGRHAKANYDGEQYEWPNDYDKLTRAMIAEVDQVNEAIESNTPKRVAKSAPEEEPVNISIGLSPNIDAGEKLLTGRDDLKAKMSDIIQEGIEYVYAPSDLGWQWALDRANWNTIRGAEVSRRIKIKTNFTEGAVGVEMGTGPKKRASRSKAKAAPDPEPESAATETASEE